MEPHAAGCRSALKKTPSPASVPRPAVDERVANTPPQVSRVDAAPGKATDMPVESAEESISAPASHVANAFGPLRVKFTTTTEISGRTRKTMALQVAQPACCAAAVKTSRNCSAAAELSMDPFSAAAGSENMDKVQRMVDSYPEPLDEASRELKGVCEAESCINVYIGVAEEELVAMIVCVIDRGGEALHEHVELVDGLKETRLADGAWLPEGLGKDGPGEGV